MASPPGTITTGWQQKVTISSSGQEKAIIYAQQKMQFLPCPNGQTLESKDMDMNKALTHCNNTKAPQEVVCVLFTIPHPQVIILVRVGA